MKLNQYYTIPSPVGWIFLRHLRFYEPLPLVLVLLLLLLPPWLFTYFWSHVWFRRPCLSPHILWILRKILYKEKRREKGFENKDQVDYKKSRKRKWSTKEEIRTWWRRLCIIRKANMHGLMLTQGPLGPAFTTRGLGPTSWTVGGPCTTNLLKNKSIEITLSLISVNLEKIYRDLPYLSKSVDIYFF